MADISFNPAHQESGQSTIKVLAEGHTRDHHWVQMYLAADYHDNCNAISEPGFHKSIDEVFGPYTAWKAVEAVGGKYDSGKTLIEKAETNEGIKVLEDGIKDSMNQVLGDFCLTVDSVTLKNLMVQGNVMTSPEEHKN